MFRNANLQAKLHLTNAFHMHDQVQCRHSSALAPLCTAEGCVCPSSAFDPDLILMNSWMRFHDFCPSNMQHGAGSPGVEWKVILGHYNT
jgi:hypothetical protein